MLFRETLCVILAFPFPFNKRIQQNLSPQLGGRQCSHPRSSLCTPLLLRHTERSCDRGSWPTPALGRTAGGSTRRATQGTAHAPSRSGEQRYQCLPPSVCSRPVRPLFFLPCAAYLAPQQPGPAGTAVGLGAQRGMSLPLARTQEVRGHRSDSSSFWSICILLSINSLFYPGGKRNQNSVLWGFWFFLFKKRDGSFVWGFLWDRNNFNMGYVSTAGSFPVICQEKPKPTIRSRFNRIQTAHVKWDSTREVGRTVAQQLPVLVASTELPNSSSTGDSRGDFRHTELRGTWYQCPAPKEVTELTAHC